MTLPLSILYDSQPKRACVRSLNSQPSPYIYRVDAAWRGLDSGNEQSSWLLARRRTAPKTFAVNGPVTDMLRGMNARLMLLACLLSSVSSVSSCKKPLGFWG